MKTSSIFAKAIIFGSTLAAPSIKRHDADYTKLGYPDGTGKDLSYYPPPAGGWESIDYPTDTGENINSKPKQEFTSTYHIVALGKNVVNGTAPNVKSTPGPEDAVGLFDYMINGPQDLICWDIILINVKGAYKSAARTATHIHEAQARGNGPPRIAFPNPEGDDRVRRSSGCMTGPFTTGLAPTGVDTGKGFKVQQIEDNPAGFFTDSHTELFVPGVVRGQLA